MLPASSSSTSVNRQSTVSPIDKPQQQQNIDFVAPLISSPIGQAQEATFKDIALLEPTDHHSGLENLSSILENAERDKTFTGPVIPILVFACNRVSVRKCLDNLIEYRPNINQFPIIVSQVNIDYCTNNLE